MSNSQPMTSIELLQTLASIGVTLDEGALARMQQNPTSTIEPRPAIGNSAAGHALSVLQQLGGSGARLPVSLEKVIGEGGMGIVHLGRQESLEREVAVKTIRPAVRTQ